MTPSLHADLSVCNMGAGALTMAALCVSCRFALACTRLAHVVLCIVFSPVTADACAKHCDRAH